MRPSNSGLQFSEPNSPIEITSPIVSTCGEESVSPEGGNRPRSPFSVERGNYDGSRMESYRPPQSKSDTEEEEGNERGGESIESDGGSDEHEMDRREERRGTVREGVKSRDVGEERSREGRERGGGRGEVERGGGTERREEGQAEWKERTPVMKDETQWHVDAADIIERDILVDANASTEEGSGKFIVPRTSGIFQC